MVRLPTGFAKERAGTPALCQPIVGSTMVGTESAFPFKIVIEELAPLQLQGLWNERGGNALRPLVTANI